MNDYADALVADADLPAPLSDEQGAWLDRVRAVELYPAALTRRLLELATLADLAAPRPDVVTPAGALRYIAAELRRLAGRAAGDV